jgi:hypothetical protein
MDAIKISIGYTARRNFASFNLALEYRNNDVFDLMSGCLDAVERMPAGAVERDIMEPDVTISAVAWRQR